VLDLERNSQRQDIAHRMQAQGRKRKNGGLNARDETDKHPGENFTRKKAHPNISRKNTTGEKTRGFWGTAWGRESPKICWQVK